MAVRRVPHRHDAPSWPARRLGLAIGDRALARSSTYSRACELSSLLTFDSPAPFRPEWLFPGERFGFFFSSLFDETLSSAQFAVRSQAHEGCACGCKLYAHGDILSADDLSSCARSLELFAFEGNTLPSKRIGIPILFCWWDAASLKDRQSFESVLLFERGELFTVRFQCCRLVAVTAGALKLLLSSLKNLYL